MSSELEQLLILQDRDRKITRLTREASDIPARKEQIESRLGDNRRSLEEARDELKRKEVESKSTEGRIEDLKERVKKYKNQQMAVKNNDEYRALTREISSTERKIREVEEEEIVLMESIETLRKVVAQKAAELAEEEKLVAQDVAAMAEREANILGEIEKLQAGRDELAKGIDVNWLGRYDRIFQRRGDYALVAVDSSGVCGGCFMKLPPQTVMNARGGQQITPCDYCGRILYWKHGV